MRVEELRILLALEPTWTVSLNGLEFFSIPSSDISISESAIQIGARVRKIVDVQWLRPSVVQIRARAKFRTNLDVIKLYPGERLPSIVDLRRRRRAFLRQIAPALCSWFGIRKIERETLHSDRQHGISGAYPRFLIGRNAVIAVDPDESSVVINGIMRAALLWAPLVRRPISVVVPSGRCQTIAARLDALPYLSTAFQWLEYNGSTITPLAKSSAFPETHVQEFIGPVNREEVERICGLAPDLLHAVPHISGKAMSVRLRGIEVAQVSQNGTTYPFGTPLDRVIREIDEARRYRSRHPLARAQEERWLESNLIREIRHILPTVDARHVYPQVPSFAGEERNIIDLLTVTNTGRLVVIEIKVSPDPDLPFQALDYWLAVERHRNANDFLANGYFKECRLEDRPALLVLVAPLLSYHKTLPRLLAAFPKSLPMMQIGINQTWKQNVKILHRRGMLS